MKLRLFSFPVILFALLVSSCAPSAAPTPADAPVSSGLQTDTPAAPTVTQAPTAAPVTATPAEATLTPTAPPASQDTGCIDSASFVADVTVPDDTQFKQGDPVHKTWRIMNTGTCRWNTGYSLVFAAGTQMGGPSSVPFAYNAASGSPLDITIDLTAPSADGAYVGNYELHNAAGQAFPIDGGKYIWLKITVGTAVMVQTSGGGSTSSGSTGGGTTSGSATTASTGSGTSGDCAYQENAAFTAGLLTEINAARAANGLGALTLNATLSSAAMAHSIDMACHSALTHTGWDGSSPKSRVSAAGYSYSYEQESIYAQPPQYGGDAAAAVDWWLNDPPHRLIILSDKAKDLGVGYAYVPGSALGGYFTVELAAP